MQHGFTRGNRVPANGIKLGYQNDSGDYWLAVANTQWGRIPGKANKDGNCWYGYYEKEYSTNDFDWVTHPNTMTTIPNSGYGGPPRSCRPIGFQNDGRGDQYAIIANTRWGKIAGKACENTAWYCYNGIEYETTEFEWLSCTRLNNSHRNNMDIAFVQQHHPPENALKFGRQNDGGGEHCIAVAETPHGKIPGKAKDGTCWYGFCGKEMTTSNFHYVVHASPHELVRNNNSGPPRSATPVGRQTDGRGDQYAALASTQWGKIPGKAVGNTCWFPYMGTEHETADFEWVVFAN